MTVVVEGRDFALHRAMLWARSTWFRALLGERWRRDTRRVEVSAMSAAVFEVLVEFLYTEYVRLCALSVCVCVLMCLCICVCVYVC